MKQASLFDLSPIAEALHERLYPHAPGYKEAETSKAAAIAMKPRASKLRDRAMEQLQIETHYGRGCTADELAERCKVTVLSMRPRITELNKLGLIEKSGIRRKNASGQTAHVWRAKDAS